ncbi:MAG: YheU family protein [Porticoccus sp.]
MIEIPLARISGDILNAIIEDFIAREGTDYGSSEVGFETKIEQVKRQIERGDVVITFDPETESCNLLTKYQFQRFQQDQRLQQEQQ